MENLKVHSKLIHIHRVGSKKEQLITYVGTGNFHEKTANMYEDLGLLTVDDRIGKEVARLFGILDGYKNDHRFEHLFVAPYNMRSAIEKLIETEIDNAQNGLSASIKLKLNNLVDATIIAHLYKASQAGVKLELLVRGICCVVPGITGLSENITIRSIVGRYLEHSRYMIFNNNGVPKYYIASADLMERNLDKRIEVGCPVYDEALQTQLSRIFEMQWKGNVKSRIIDENQSNIYFQEGEVFYDSQKELHEHYKLS